MKNNKTILIGISFFLIITGVTIIFFLGKHRYFSIPPINNSRNENSRTSILNLSNKTPQRNDNVSDNTQENKNDVSTGGSNFSIDELIAKVTSQRANPNQIARIKSKIIDILKKGEGWDDSSRIYYHISEEQGESIYRIMLWNGKEGVLGGIAVLRDPQVPLKVKETLAGEPNFPYTKECAAVLLDEIEIESNRDIKSLLFSAIDEQRAMPKLLKESNYRDRLFDLFYKETDTQIKQQIISLLFSGIKEDPLISDFMRQLVLDPKVNEDVKFNIINYLSYTSNDNDIQCILSIINNSNFTPFLREVAMSTLDIIKKMNPESFTQYYNQVSATLWELAKIAEQKDITKEQMELSVSAMEALCTRNDSLLLNWLFARLDSPYNPQNEIEINLRYHTIKTLRHYHDEPIVINKLWDIIKNEQETEDIRCRAIHNLGLVSLEDDFASHARENLNILLKQTSSNDMKESIGNTLRFLENPPELRRMLYERR